MTGNSLVSICYEPVAPGFAYGLFGGVRLVIDTQTGFFNATRLCEEAGKSFRNWMRSKQTKEYVKHLKETCDEPLFYERYSRSDRMSDVVRGTYASWRFVTPLVSWVSPAFQDKTERIVWKELRDEFEEKRERNEIRIVPPETLREEPSKAAEDAPEKTVPENKRLFVLVRTGGVYPYHAVRCSKKCKSTQLKKLKRRYPDAVQVFEVVYDPKAVKLFDVIKQKIKDITTHLNEIELLNGYTVESFERDVRKIVQEVEEKD